ncbi:unnamed protein product [Urochloa humidicola]
MAATEHRAQVVLFPFMAQGHIAPFRCLVELVRRARPDAGVTIVAANPSVAQSLRASLPTDEDVDARRGFSVHALPFNPAEHGLPAGADTSAKIGSHQLTTLFNASESLRPAFCRFVAGLRAAAGPGADLHIVADMFLGWTVDVARDAGVSHSIVFTCGGYGAALYFSLWNSVPLPGDTFTLPQFPEVSIERSQLTDQLATADGGDARSLFLRKQIAAFSRADALLVNTTEGLEPKGLAMLRRWFSDVPICPVGPLLRTTAVPSPEARDSSSTTILIWLDKQRPGSVLYVSFGSQYTINASQMLELAMGLERSAHKFVCVIRPPSGFDVNGEFRPEWLPEGFKKKVEESGQGLVVQCWAPQVEILAHPATGAFLTHCGWNSVQESLAHGVPMIGWPLSAEQFYNAKMLVEEMGVCVEVARGGDTVVKEKIVEVVDTVLGETSVRATISWKATEVKKVIRAAWDTDGDGSSVSMMERFFAAVSRVA